MVNVDQFKAGSFRDHGAGSALIEEDKVGMPDRDFASVIQFEFEGFERRTVNDASYLLCFHNSSSQPSHQNYTPNH